MVFDIGAELSGTDVVVIKVVLVALIADAPPTGVGVASCALSDSVKPEEAKQLGKEANNSQNERLIMTLCMSL